MEDNNQYYIRAFYEENWTQVSVGEYIYAEKACGIHSVSHHNFIPARLNGFKGFAFQGKITQGELQFESNQAK